MAHHQRIGDIIYLLIFITAGRVLPSERKSTPRYGDEP